LVDSAKQPMQAAPLSVLRSVITQGHQQKLAIAFTHFDQLNGDDLPDFAAKRDHVMASVNNGLASLGKDRQDEDALGSTVLRGIERDLRNRCFFLDLDKRREREDEFDREAQLKKLLQFCQRNIEKPTSQAMPVYALSDLVSVLQQATPQFHALWEKRLKPQSSGGVHQRTLWAFNQRIAGQTVIEYQDLKPVAELEKYLTEAISRFLSQPRWDCEPGHSISDEEKDTIIDAIRQAVAVAVKEVAKPRLIDQPLSSWQTAARFSGTGSTARRAREIQGIYQTAVPAIQNVLEPVSSAFLQELQQKLYRAIRKGGGKLPGYMPFPIPTLEELERAYREANREVDPVWDGVVADGLADEAW